MRRVTIEDVAREAGVSRQTVSRAINLKGEIHPDTRERVLAVVDKLRYQPNRSAQGMVNQRTYTVGVEVPDITNPVFTEFARGAQDVAAQHRYNLFLGYSDSAPFAAIHTLSNFVTHGVDGLIGILGNVPDQEIRAFADQYRPLVLINREIVHPNISSVTVNIYQGARLATDYLVQQGHTAIGILVKPEAQLDSSRRMRGYQDALRRHELAEHEGWIARATPHIQGGYEATRHLLTSHPELTAIFAFNDMMAIGACRACRDLGRRVPEECAIIGFDDNLLASIVSPTLTTIRYDKYALGQLAMQRVLEMITSPDVAFPSIQLPLELVPRESTDGSTHSRSGRG